MRFEKCVYWCLVPSDKEVRKLLMLDMEDKLFGELASMILLTVSISINKKTAADHLLTYGAIDMLIATGISSTNQRSERINEESVR
jgi:hypothetical protein